MKLIKCLSDLIGEEIGDAKKYAKLALQYRDERRQLADVFFSLSQQEMQHMQTLHDEVVQIINEYRSTNGEPPAEMMAIYDYLHEKHIDEAGEAKAMQALYKR